MLNENITTYHKERNILTIQSTYNAKPTKDLIEKYKNKYNCFIINTMSSLEKIIKKYLLIK